jgi:hypothetical protein
MASTIPPVLVELQLETANLKAQMQKLNDNFSNFGDTVKKQTSFLSNFKAAAVGVFAGNVMTQGLNMLKAGLTGAIADAQAYEKATAQLKAGIISTGNEAGLSVSGLQAHASALESLAAVDENLIMQSQAVFQTFTNVRNVVGEGNDIFNQATVAALDLSTKMGGDLQGATVQLGKALNDPIKGITALTRVGVVFTQGQKDQIKALMESGDVMGAQKIILAEMNKEFGGAAAAAGDTFAGAVFRAKDKVADFARTFITNLQPILLSIGKTLGDLYTKYLAPLVKIIVSNKEALLAFTGVLLTGYAAMKAYGVIMGVVKTAQALYAVAQVLMTGGQLASIASTNGLAASMLKLNAAMYANPIGLIVGAVALLAAGFVLLWNNSDTFRKIMIGVAKAVLTGVGFMIRIFGSLIETIAKVYTGPLRILLTVLSKLPGVGKYAKAGLEIINTGIGMIGDFADKAADKVEGFKDTLDGLADKKIKLPGFGGGTKEEPAVEGQVVVGGLTAEQIKAAKASAKERAKLLAKAKEDVKKTYGEMNKVISEARAKSVEIETEFNLEVIKINQKYAAKALAIQKDYENKALELEVEADEKRASIIQKGRELLTNAFQSGTKLDLGKMFEDSDKSGAGLVAKLKEKFAAIAKLQQAAGALASAGFTQTFIQDVVSQGPEAGNAMAEAILKSSPESISEMQNLFMGIEDISKNGLNQLAEQMSTSTSFATQELLEEYENVGVELKNALTKNSTDLAEALSNNQKELQDSLLAAQTAYNEAIDKLEKDTKDKLASLQDKLRETAETIRQLAGAKAAAGALAGSPAAPILAGTGSLGLAAKSEGSLVINNTTNISGTNLTDPQATANVVSDAMRFGAPQGLGLSLYRRVAEL